MDVDAGDWHQLVKDYPPTYHAPSGRPGRRHLVYRDTEARADKHWDAEGCSGDIRSAGPVILYDPAQLLAALDIGLRGVTFPAEVFTGNSTGATTIPGRDQGTTEGNPSPTSKSPRGVI